MIRPILFGSAFALALPALASPSLPGVDDRAPHVGAAPAFDWQTRAPALPETPVRYEIFVSDLEHPWGIAALPEGGWLVTERPGRMRVIGADGSVGAPLRGLPSIRANAQGGLLDVVLDPDFTENRRVWWTYSSGNRRGTMATLAHGTLDADLSRITGATDVFLQSPRSVDPMHYGSRIVFDGEGHVFMTLGERFTDENRVLAQDLTSTFGKIVRLRTDGSIPSDNPLVGQPGEDAIWSWGHRNPQGAAIQPGTGALWSVEHGPRGGDELNLILPARNYGWPIVSHGENYNRTPVGEGEVRAEGLEEPVYFWDPAIAPSGMTFYDGEMFPGWQGDILIASLNPGGLIRLRLEGERVVGEEWLLRDVGRVRDVSVAPDGAVLLLTDFPDGEILRVTPTN